MTSTPKPLSARALDAIERGKRYASADTIRALNAELFNAREQYPTNDYLLDRTMIQAKLLERMLTDPAIEPAGQLKACIVMACLAIRLYEEHGLKNALPLNTDELEKFANSILGSG